MTTVETAYQIIRRWTKHVDKIKGELEEKGIGFVKAPGSPEMHKRYWAHTRYLAKQIGKTFGELKAEAEEYAMGFGEWPTKVYARDVEIEGVTHTIDFEIPQSSTRATDKQLLRAYEHITQTADEHKVRLPENIEEVE